jgi:uncharacterized membrane protein
MSATDLPRTIDQYLARLRVALRDADPAMRQDALYDAEEYLRAELASNPGSSEAEVVSSVAGSYGAPEEVADIYRDTEVTVARALRPPLPPRRRSALGRFFAVAADARTWSALFYMMLSAATGIFYFTWAVTGLSLSAGLALLIIGVPFVILFFASVRLLSLVEGRIVETLLGERMPRRPTYAAQGEPILTRIGAMFTDPRTWSTLVYMLLMLPLGMIYFTLTTTGLTLSLGLIAAPIAQILGEVGLMWIDDAEFLLPVWASPLTAVLGVALLFTLLHLIRAIGRSHGLLAKHLLVKMSRSD